MIRGRSQLSTFMKAYTAYARGRGSWTTVRFFPENQHLILITDNVLYLKYGRPTRLESGQTAHICRSFMYNYTFVALFLTSKCTQSNVLWTQTVAPHRGFSMAAQRRFR